MIRGGFESELKEIKSKILEMGQVVEMALQRSIDSFKVNDHIGMDEVIRNDHKINQFELNINESVTLLIAKQQPVASDLRKLIVALKISSDLERIGDLAVDIAKVGKRVRPSDLKEYRSQLISISQRATEMLSSAIAAYYHSDILKAQKIANLDDTVDRMYGEFIQSLFKLESNSRQVENVINLAFIGRYIERIADYATNLAECIVYEVNGQYFDLN
ncbi:phosphate signaling complex protein PhoU [Alkalihalobacterium alkalinitrilicum]|uniref:phosphate signaling complex protein PhoU n=1 Tax=Alkalihalobacterium alkalinitrilicum TaxID=427920 RepID=UPI0009956232|nr:phosphate signaling complex protein PhoU [Alkalihalobacterium alkalinitrilicum]